MKRALRTGRLAGDLRRSARGGCAALLVVLAGCAAVVDGTGHDAGGGGAEAPQSMVPAGYGTLRQDDATVSLRAGEVLVKLTPLDEATIRLLAPDTYTRLNALRESRREEAERRVLRSPELFLVSFFSHDADVAFQPEDIQLLHQARLLRPSAILPVSSGWGRQRLAQQETQMAVYVFEGPIEYDQPVVVRYGVEESDEWRRIVQRLEAERARVQARVRG
jgi:hypothetical protein